MHRNILHAQVYDACIEYNSQGFILYTTRIPGIWGYNGAIFAYYRGCHMCIIADAMGLFSSIQGFLAFGFIMGINIYAEGADIAGICCGKHSFSPYKDSWNMVIPTGGFTG
jgi:hypothetical protein